MSSEKRSLLVTIRVGKTGAFLPRSICTNRDVWDSVSLGMTVGNPQV